MIDPLPCPFCGAKPFKFSSEYGDEYVQCTNVECKVHPSVDNIGGPKRRAKVGDVTEAWNRRVVENAQQASMNSIVEAWKHGQGAMPPLEELVRELWDDLLARRAEKPVVTDLEQPPKCTCGPVKTGYIVEYRGIKTPEGTVHRDTCAISQWNELKTLRRKLFEGGEQVKELLDVLKHEYEALRTSGLRNRRIEDVLKKHGVEVER